MPKGEWLGWGEVVPRPAMPVWGLFLIIIILGGIYGWLSFTPTEAAAVPRSMPSIASFVYTDMGPLAASEARQHLACCKALSLVTVFPP